MTVFFKWRQMFSYGWSGWQVLAVPSIERLKKMGYKSYKAYLKERLEDSLSTWSEHYRGWQAKKTLPTKEWLESRIEDSQDNIKALTSTVREYKRLLKTAKPEPKKKIPKHLRNPKAVLARGQALLKARSKK